jgi:hypothetical protein
VVGTENRNPVGLLAMDFDRVAGIERNWVINAADRTADLAPKGR